MRTAANWSAATPRAARSTSASRSSARCRPARRCCAPARGPATTSGSAAAWATPGWRWKSSAARWHCRRRPSPRPARAWSSRRRGSRSAWHCAASRRAAVDISDGLAGDLGHVLRASGVGARLDADAAAALLAIGGQLDGAALGIDARRASVLAGGDDYELAFTAPPRRARAVAEAGRAAATPVTRIGTIEAEAGLRVVDATGRVAERAASLPSITSPEPRGAAKPRIAAPRMRDTVARCTLNPFPALRRWPRWPVRPSASCARTRRT